MSQVKLLKIHPVDGVPVEMDSSSDEVTLSSFSVAGGGPVLSSTGLDLQGQDLTDVGDILMIDPSVGTINQTSGALVVDNILGKDRTNLMTTSGSVQFPAVSDTASQTSLLRVPSLASMPTATPSGGVGSLVFNSAEPAIYVYTGTQWLNTSESTSARVVDDNYTAGATIASNKAVYISAADTVDLADCSLLSKKDSIGFSTYASTSGNTIEVRKLGLLAGFTGLVPGKNYYLSTAGDVTPSIPTGSGATILMMGIAKNATVLDIRCEYLGRRA
jgi:hypothetical protein